MVRSYLKLVKFTVFLSILILMLLRVFNHNGGYIQTSWIFYLMIPLCLLITTAIYLPFHIFVRDKANLIERLSIDQATFLDNIPIHYINFAIIGSAGASLFLELAVIRWQSEMFPIFAFYKNYSLLACFAGLGLGYALAKNKAIPLFLYLPVFAIQFVLMIILRYKSSSMSLWTTPFAEQLTMTMGLDVSTTFSSLSLLYFFFTIIFILTVVGFLPVGQLCGRLMTRRENLRAYGFNLLGSILGVILVTTISFFWAPPVIWFCICFAILLFFQGFNARVLLMGALSITAAVIILSWPLSPGYELIHSPYQLLERGVGNRGLTMIKAAGHYYQHIHDLSLSNANRHFDNALRETAAYYELPYRIYGKQPLNVAIVGSGTGNDVAAALRCGAKHVDAIEIDPAILKLGYMYHPEKPYADTRVNSVVNDARTFFRMTHTAYDMVVYGLLDSHTLLSHASSIRLDSFVYTIEALKEARQLLKSDGLMSLSFCILSDEIGRKIYLMMKSAFEGKPPICIRSKYDASVIFFQSRDGTLTLDRDLLVSAGFEDMTSYYANPKTHADLPTDDWPFFYMPKRIYPFSYLVMMALILILSSFTTFSFIKEQPTFSNSAFFFLGAGFMLIETKAITELGLTFGNTWQVIGIAISGVLLMAFLANCVVQWFNIRRPFPWVLFIIISLLVGYLVSSQGGFGSSISGKINTVILLTCPMFFSGIIFSTLLSRDRYITGVMAVNILGAMAGGVLEYNSMYFGFRFLYLLAILMYILAILAYYLNKRGLMIPESDS